MSKQNEIKRVECVLIEVMHFPYVGKELAERLVNNGIGTSKRFELEPIFHKEGSVKGTLKDMAIIPIDYKE